MADEQPDLETIDIAAVVAKRLERAPSDDQRRAEYLADRAAREEQQLERQAARNRVRAAAHARVPAEPADIALALSDD